MFKKTVVRFIIIGVVVLLACYSLYWTVAYHSFSAEKREALRADGSLDKYERRIIRLGLDLQGGMHIVMEVDLPKLIESLASNKTPQFMALLDEANNEAIANEADFFDVFRRKINESDIKLVRHFNGRGFKNDEIIKSLEDEAKDAVDRAMEVIRNRVDQFGVSEPSIQKSGKYRIIVELAGIQDISRAKELIQSTALLEFILLKDAAVTQQFITAVDNYLKTGKPIEVIPETHEEADSIVALKESKDKAISVDELLGITSPEAGLTAERADTGLIVDEEIYKDRPFSSLLRNIDNQIGVPERNVYAVKKILEDPNVKKLIPFDSKFLWSAKPERRTLQDGRTENFYILYHVHNEPALLGKYVTKASASVGGAGSQSSGRPIVNINMNSEGARIFAKVTGANIGKQLAVVLDDKVYTAPFIKVKIPDGSAYIEGMADMEEAKDIAIVLRAGALPAPMTIVEERTVGPSLGKDSIAVGIRVGIFALLVIMLFMFFYYRRSGLLADMALILNLVFTLAIMAMLRATLTLPGIAGLVLTIGMAVDANVLIFERIREELERGKTVSAAVSNGYSRALSAILDSNITTLLTAIILMQTGTGPVKGFAVTLFWGIASSMFTAIFVTRTFFNWRIEKHAVKTLSI
ncbi:MAG TPA: protein translocase subunit SecD [Candidatus Marinimicrobia bacterium]|nr:protein translocase subunit SecD [Candidatus Neomarinimicrobiota bacterium]HRS51780.1 protein translocase subunit SecD [Candidatus Neomarinimicrobiota bacterium]HRU93050.1 protein translocase subunit SecD [Candidatus Neomarinimicrobiota bacterium]